MLFTSGKHVFPVPSRLVLSRFQLPTSSRLAYIILHPCQGKSIDYSGKAPCIPLSQASDSIHQRSEGVNMGKVCPPNMVNDSDESKPIPTWFRCAASSTVVPEGTVTFAASPPGGGSVEFQDPRQSQTQSIGI